ncbi:hypothetical protein QR680_017268 [Steinernema hermaphroditum]|uniref:Uncharacterized protein n=1 Tax=Steinernema hermaphroditum TaxID=289476 RepID=A0AA39HGC4_9BILA|nr:hypothetical protein QR680_017268 [Steinernema hermaphroditum]
MEIVVLGVWRSSKANLSNLSRDGEWLTDFDFQLAAVALGVNIFVFDTIYTNAWVMYTPETAAKNVFDRQPPFPNRPTCLILSTLDHYNPVYDV